ncbi:MAG TPA: LPS export ABC transporter permease LptG [Candidatus Acidoferrales bacterium]|nr:LPS export ABC transporter permease LptG [Candidatus Acidoferrales bacterium]
MKLRLIDRYIFSEIGSYALLGLFVFTFIFFVPQLVRLMDLVVSHAAGLGTIALLVGCTLPAILTFTLPMGVLVGVLIGLGRLSADSELIALQSLGFDRKRILFPVGVLAVGTAAATLWMTAWAGPPALEKLHETEEALATSQASFAVQPRVFEEQFPHMVLYVSDVTGGGTKWKGILLAQTDEDAGSRITFAESGIVLPDPQHGALQFHLMNGTTHEFLRNDPRQYAVSTFGREDLPVSIEEGAGRKHAAPTLSELPFRELARQYAAGDLQARVELHRRIAFPAACLVFALLGVPVGIRPKRGGRASGFVMTLLMVSGYYLLFVTGAGLAKRGVVPAGVGMWAANVITALCGLALVPGMDQIRSERGWWERMKDWFRPQRKRRAKLSGRLATVRPGHLPGPRAARGYAFPLLMDLYLLRSFFFYTLLFLAAFIFIFHSFTFFELLEDIGKHHAGAGIVMQYFLFLTPYMFYQLVPVAALIGVLVTLGVLSKNNEVTAFKACGVSLYRLSLPLLLAGVALAVLMFSLDDTILPICNQRQDALRNQIKGHPAQTFFQPRRQWIFGEGDRLYNYDYFDPQHNVFAGLSIFELDPATFQLKKRAFFARAKYEENLSSWVLENGWVRTFDGGRVASYLPYRVTELPEFTEPPSYFNREVRPYTQMSWAELGEYIRELHQAGFDVSRLSVQWHKKFAYPVIVPIIMLLAIPFAFLVGTRGAVGGLALGVGIGVVYWATSALAEAIGAAGQLPPVLAGWGPAVAFGFTGIYFFLRMKT